MKRTILTVIMMGVGWFIFVSALDFVSSIGEFIPLAIIFTLTGLAISVGLDLNEYWNRDKSKEYKKKNDGWIDLTKQTNGENGN